MKVYISLSQLCFESMFNLIYFTNPIVVVDKWAEKIATSLMMLVVIFYRLIKDLPTPPTLALIISEEINLRQVKKQKSLGINTLYIYILLLHSFISSFRATCLSSSGIPPPLLPRTAAAIRR